jgi:hypothetical protein
MLMATDVDGDDVEGNNASLMTWDEGNNRNRDDGEDACAQPVVRQWRI